MPVLRSMLQSLKLRLVMLGPEHWALRASLHLAAWRAGWRLSFTGDSIQMRRGSRVVVLPLREYVSVPMMFDYSKLYFDTLVPRRQNGLEVWDYSRPDWHTYRRSGLEFYCPALPEDDIFDSYTHWYTPAAGDVVWDVGAHAGVTTCYLSQLVGPAGKVYAFEPDPLNYSCLQRNIERHQLTNVVPLQLALAGSSGTAKFQMIGTMAAGLRDYLSYPDSEENYQDVPTISLEDACTAYGVPRYIKMDIEGAEVPVLAASLDFLRKHAIEFAIESHHLINNRLTYLDLDELFPRAGYDSESSLEYQLWYTWATPRKNPA
jgi:FkbM family methyltransferase